MSRWILVAEDERTLGEMLCDNLTLESYHAEHVFTGPRALDRMAKGGIDLLILDVMLPGLDGFEVLKQLRARGDQTPVLILSARSADQDRIRGLELQADDYLTKPFNLRELLLRVDGLLRRRPAPAAGSDRLAFGGHEEDFRGGRTPHRRRAPVRQRRPHHRAHAGQRDVAAAQAVRAGSGGPPPPAHGAGHRLPVRPLMPG